MVHIKHWYPKDMTFFKVLSISGNIRPEDANKLNISNSRLKNMERDRLIERVTHPSRYNKQQNSNQSYALTKKGKEFVESKFGISRCQSGHACEHNCKVAEVICNLDKREIETVQSEWETRNQMMECIEQMRSQGEYDRYDEYMELWKQGAISAVDVVYVSSKTNLVTGVEITTGSYKDSDISAKEICSEILDIEIEYVNVV